MSKHRKDRISVTVPEKVIAEIKARAEKENRNFSNMATVLLIEGLKTKAA